LIHFDNGETEREGRTAQLKHFMGFFVCFGQGSFTLQLRGLLPSVNLGLPEHIDYKYCPVKDVTTKTFDIHNDQDFIVGFKWLSVTHPFSITPTQGNLRPGQVMTMSCHFCPDNATAYKGVVRNIFVSPEVFSLLAVVLSLESEYVYGLSFCFFLERSSLDGI